MVEASFLIFDITLAFIFYNIQDKAGINWPNLKSDRTLKFDSSEALY